MVISPKSRLSQAVTFLADYNVVFRTFIRIFCATPML